MWLNGYGTPAGVAMPDGGLLLRRAPSLLRTGTHYDLISREGRLVGALGLAQNEMVIGFGQRSIYVVVTSDVGLQSVRRHPWP